MKLPLWHWCRTTALAFVLLLLLAIGVLADG